MQRERKGRFERVVFFLPEWNENARQFAEKTGIACVVGSDAHSTTQSGQGGMASKEHILKSRDDTIMRSE